jgi:hypothetical protein
MQLHGPQDCIRAAVCCLGHLAAVFACVHVDYTIVGSRVTIAGPVQVLMTLNSQTQFDVGSSTVTPLVPKDSGRLSARQRSKTALMVAAQAGSRRMSDVNNSSSISITATNVAQCLLCVSESAALGQGMLPWCTAAKQSHLLECTECTEAK